MTTTIQTSHTFTSFEKIPVTIFSDAQEACKAVAIEIAELIRSKQREGSNTVLGLATGATPKKIYQQLIQMYREEGLSFKNVICFNLDEYFPISGESIQSYKYFMQENLFNHIDIEPDNCHILDGEIGLENIKQH